jgi:hypothetical protein
MGDRLIYWLDRMIYVWGDTMPDAKESDPTSQMEELKELKKIRAWVKRALAK